MRESALIGYGYWGQILAQYINKSKEFNLVKILSKRAPKDKRRAESIVEIARDSNIEVVFIATPTATHFNLASTMLGAGKDVFCEKPATKSLKEWERLKEIASAYDRVLYIDYPYVHSPTLNYIKAHLAELGEIEHISCAISQFGRFYPSESCFETVGLHPLSSILSILESPLENARFESFFKAGDGMCVYGTSSFRLRSGTSAILTVNQISSERRRNISFYGNKGSFDYEMHRDPALMSQEYDLSSDHPIRKASVGMHFNEEDTLERVLDDFASSLQSGSAEGNSWITDQIQLWLYLANKSIK